MKKKLLTPTGEQISVLVSSNDSYTFLDADNYNMACQIKKELDRQSVDSLIDFTQKLGWFVRVHNFLFPRIKFME